MRQVLFIMLSTSYLFPTSFDSQDGAPIRQGVHVEWYRTVAPGQQGEAIFVWSDTRYGMRNIFAHKVNQEGVLKWRINIKALIENSLEISDFPDIQVNSSTKTLFLFGSNSEYSVSSQKDYIKKLFLSASFKEIKGAGHWVQAEKPKDFLEIVSNFLKSNYSKN